MPRRTPVQMLTGAIQAEYEAASTRRRRAADASVMPGPLDGARYRLIEAIGPGTVSEVWAAESLSDGAIVAIKRLREQWAAKRAARTSLRNEWLVLAGLRHRSIVHAHQWLEHDQMAPTDGSVHPSPGIVLDLLSGGDLVAVAGGEPAVWAGAAEDIVAALRYLHHRGIVHGDIKARNILFDCNDRAYLTDFSSAEPVGEMVRSPFGTVTQQRPRSDGHIVTVDDDIFALAALIFELIAGRPPHSIGQSSQPRELAAALLGERGARLVALERLIHWVIDVLSSDSMRGRETLIECENVLAALRNEIAALPREKH